MTDIDPIENFKQNDPERNPCPKCGCAPIAVVQKTGRSCTVVADKSCIVTDVGIEWEYIHLSGEHLP